jgi:transcriptional regulator of arginine metabolism
MSKANRQFSIKQIITDQEITSQEDLAQALTQAGFDVNQATLSRDLREMGIVRLPTATGSKYSFVSDTEDARLRALLAYEVKSIACNESLVVVKTLAGRAQGVAELIDSMKHPEILATLAGDNTIFIAPRSVQSIDQVVAALKEFITTD